MAYEHGETPSWWEGLLSFLFPFLMYFQFADTNRKRVDKIGGEQKMRVAGLLQFLIGGGLLALGWGNWGLYTPYVAGGVPVSGLLFTVGAWLAMSVIRGAFLYSGSQNTWGSMASPGFIAETFTGASLNRKDARARSRDGSLGFWNTLIAFIFPLATAAQFLTRRAQFKKVSSDWLRDQEIRTALGTAAQLLVGGGLLMMGWYPPASLGSSFFVNGVPVSGILFTAAAWLAMSAIRGMSFVHLSNTPKASVDDSEMLTTVPVKKTTFKRFFANMFFGPLYAMEPATDFQDSSERLENVARDEDDSDNGRGDEIAVGSLPVAGKADHQEASYRDEDALIDHEPTSTSPKANKGEHKSNLSDRVDPSLENYFRWESIEVEIGETLKILRDSKQPAISLVSIKKIASVFDKARMAVERLKGFPRGRMVSDAINSINTKLDALDQPLLNFLQNNHSFVQAVKEKLEANLAASVDGMLENIEDDIRAGRLSDAANKMQFLMLESRVAPSLSAAWKPADEVNDSLFALYKELSDSSKQAFLESCQSLALRESHHKELVALKSRELNGQLSEAIRKCVEAWDKKLKIIEQGGSLGTDDAMRAQLEQMKKEFESLKAFMAPATVRLFESRFSIISSQLNPPSPAHSESESDSTSPRRKSTSENSDSSLGSDSEATLPSPHSSPGSIARRLSDSSAATSRGSSRTPSPEMSPTAARVMPPIPLDPVEAPHLGSSQSFHRFSLRIVEVEASQPVEGRDQEVASQGQKMVVGGGGGIT